MGCTVPGLTGVGTDWRVVDGVVTAWFDAPSLIEGAALARRIVELSAEIVVDLHAEGMRVRLDSDEQRDSTSAGASGADGCIVVNVSGSNRCDRGPYSRCRSRAIIES